jgi:enoyl-CoA hydratase/carnithine racemase
MDHIRYDVADHIATITIDRPEKKGAMTYAMLADFISTVHRASKDADARVVIVTGAPGTFCAGTDLADLATIPGTERGTRGTAEDHDVWWPLVRCPKPVIAAVDGPAIGMGVEFTSQCDVRIASTRARFGWVFVHRGLVPDTGAGTWLLPRLIGVPAAVDLLYSGRIIEADEALALGFVREVVESDDAMTCSTVPVRSRRRTWPARRSRSRRSSRSPTRAWRATSTSTCGRTSRRCRRASSPTTTARASPPSWSAGRRASPAPDRRDQRQANTGCS